MVVKTKVKKVAVQSSQSNSNDPHTSKPRELTTTSAPRAKKEIAVREPRIKLKTAKPSPRKQGEHGRTKKTLFKLEQRAVERPKINLLAAYESGDLEALKQINTTIPVVLDPPRKSVFKTMEIMTEICFAIANGASAFQLCQKPNMPSYTSLYAWLATDPGFKAMWDQALTLRSEKLVDELLEIADDGSNDYDYVDANGVAHVNGENIARAKLRVDTRKWLAAKLLPKKYGDKTILSGDEDAPLQLQVSQMIASGDELLKKIRGGQ